MVKSLTANGASRTLANTASVTRYLSFAGADARNPATATTDVNMKAPVAGTASRLGLRVTANARSTTTTARFYLNGAAGNQTVSIAGAATGWFEDTTNSDALAAGDTFSLQVVTGTGTGSITSTVIQFVFEATTGSKQIWGMQGPGAFNNTATVNYGGIGGGQWQTTEAQVQARAPDAGTWSNLNVYVPSNSLASAATFRSRVNGANGNQVVTVPAATTGWFEDTTNSDTVARGDLLDVSKQGTGSGAGVCTVNHLQSLFTPSNSRMLVGGGTGLTRALTAATTEYLTPHGDKHSSTTEANVTSRIPYASTCANFRFRLISGTFTTASATFRVRKNGANGNQVVTVPTGTNGTFEDTANTDSFAAGDDLSVQVVNSGISGTLYVSELSLDFFVGIEIAPTVGPLTLTGLTPTVRDVIEVAPAAGALALTGLAPTLDETFRVRPAVATLTLTGLTPETRLSGVKVSQAAALALGEVEPAARVSQAAALALAEIIPSARVSQVAALGLAEIIPALRVSQAAVLALVDAVPCHTRFAQCWKITRPDGEVFAFTAHDETVRFLGLDFIPCNSLQPSASEGATEIGAVGNMELTGIIASDAISEFDLYAGKFDGALVDVWDVPWGAGNVETPRRLAGGKMGAVSHGRRGFSAEVLGIGAQAQQQALTQVITPACRFVFGDSRCTVNVPALTVAGTVTAALGGLDRRTFADSALSGSPGFAASYFVNGVVTFLTGENAGLKSEVKEYDNATGTFVLWRRMPKPIAPGDTFTAAPGCDLSPDNCKRFSNYLNFGGFPDLPGDDAIARTPNARY